MTMRVKFLRGTALGGIGNDASPGDERDLPDHQALVFIAQGRAAALSVSLPPAPTLDAPAATLDAPDPAPKTQRKPKGK